MQTLFLRHDLEFEVWSKFWKKTREIKKERERELGTGRKRESELDRSDLNVFLIESSGQL